MKKMYQNYIVLWSFTRVQHKVRYCLLESKANRVQSFLLLGFFIIQATALVAGFTSLSKLVLEFGMGLFTKMCAIFNGMAIDLYYSFTNLVFLFLSFLGTDWILHPPTCGNWIRGSCCILPIGNLFWDFRS